MFGWLTKRFRKPKRIVSKACLCSECCNYEKCLETIKKTSRKKCSEDQVIEFLKKAEKHPETFLLGALFLGGLWLVSTLKEH